jgi:hypothetical protein
MSIESNPNEEELFLVDSSTTNSILREIRYLQTLKKEGNIITIVGRDALKLVLDKPPSLFLWVHKLQLRMLCCIPTLLAIFF